MNRIYLLRTQSIGAAKASALVTAFVVGLLVAPTASSQTVDMPAYSMCGEIEAPKPKTFSDCGSGARNYTNLRWSVWNRSKAVGTARFVAGNAQGKITRDFLAELNFSRPISCPDGTFFSRFVMYDVSKKKKTLWSDEELGCPNAPLQQYWDPCPETLALAKKPGVLKLLKQHGSLINYGRLKNRTNYELGVSDDGSLFYQATPSGQITITGSANAELLQSDDNFFVGLIGLDTTGTPECNQITVAELNIAD
jgi:hypothetical protein